MLGLQEFDFAGRLVVGIRHELLCGDAEVDGVCAQACVLGPADGSSVLRESYMGAADPKLKLESAESVGSGYDYRA